MFHSYKGISFIFFSKFLKFCFDYCHFISSFGSFINSLIILTSMFNVSVNQPIIKWFLSFVLLLFINSTLIFTFFVRIYQLLVLVIIDFLQVSCSLFSHFLFLIHDLKLNRIDHMIKLLIVFNRLILIPFFQMNILLQHRSKVFLSLRVSLFVIKKFLLVLS